MNRTSDRTLPLVLLGPTGPVRSYWSYSGLVLLHSLVLSIGRTTGQASGPIVFAHDHGRRAAHMSRAGRKNRVGHRIVGKIDRPVLALRAAPMRGL